MLNFWIELNVNVIGKLLTATLRRQEVFSRPMKNKARELFFREITLKYMLGP